MTFLRSVDMRTRRGITILILTIGSGAVIGLAQDRRRLDGEAFRSAAPAASTRIVRLREDVQLRGAIAVDQFWREMERDGAPLIEPVPGDPMYSRMTFVWRGSADTRNVVITDGVAIGVGGDDPANSQMIHIDGTDVWYRTYDVRNDARFTYALSENDPLTSFIAPTRKSNSQPDPLNARRFVTGQTYVELSDAPPQPDIAAAPERLRGRVEQLSFTGPAAPGGRNVQVYTPAGFRVGERYPLLVALGGSAYANLIPLQNILDNLIRQGRIICSPGEEGSVPSSGGNVIARSVSN